MTPTPAAAVAMTCTEGGPPRNLAPAMRASLNAKLERLLDRPIIGRTSDPLLRNEDDGQGDGAPDVFRALFNAALALTLASRATSGDASSWREHHEDGTWTVRIWLDYDALWRGREKEILDTVKGAVESAVTFLTEEQKVLLERSPREFLALNPRPEIAELLAFDVENVGGSERVIALRVAAAPEGRVHTRYVAIVPNLVQIERELDALLKIETATDDGPLAPLRALLGLCDPSCLKTSRSVPGADLGRPYPDERFDEHQSECIRKAVATPHFALIQGPPGSGKTTVISAIVRRAAERGERVLLVSPTHVAVDNVVAKLVPPEDSEEVDLLERRSIPVRYAARISKLSATALRYWVGSKRQRRGAAIARRVERRLSETVPFAKALFAVEDKDAPGDALISSAVAGVEAVICGTPIGILSFETVKRAAPASFDLLVVDEVSKMTLPEFLAIAVKARRWVLVGDPEQLPPYNNAEENATTLDDVLDPALELVCSVGAILERAKPNTRRHMRLIVVASAPERVVVAIRAHLAVVMPNDQPPISLIDDARDVGIVVCSRADAERASDMLSHPQGRDRTRIPDRSGTIWLLVQRGIARPDFASVTQLADDRLRAQAVIFESCFNVYHAQPWAVRSGQRLRLLVHRNSLERYLPSVAALEALGGGAREELLDAIAERFAVNTVSVYDWLVGIPAASFDISPLRELAAFSPAALTEAVRPFVGTLEKQYRMHSSLSHVPRALFYFGAALQDGRPDDAPGCRVSLVQVAADSDADEKNASETEAICELLTRLNADDAAQKRRPGIMIITPYRKQEAHIEQAIGVLRERGTIANLDVEVCTLDRCQGREAEYVLISLVRSRASDFFDMPKRWNVALTRAMKGLFLVGNIDAYRKEASNERREARNRAVGSQAARPLMSLLARIIDAYDRQIAASVRPSLAKSLQLRLLSRSVAGEEAAAGDAPSERTRGKKVEPELPASAWCDDDESKGPSRADIESLCVLHVVGAHGCPAGDLAKRLGLSPALAPAVAAGMELLIGRGWLELEDDRFALTAAGQLWASERLSRLRVA